MAKTLVFLEHHEGVDRRRARSACSRRRRRSAASSRRRSSAPTCASSPSAGAYGAATVWVADDARSQRRCRSRASTCSRSSSRDEGFDTVLFAQSVLAADVAAGLAARLDAGLNWGLVDFDGETGKAPQLQDTVVVDVGWSSAGQARRSSAPARSTRTSSAARPRSRTQRSSSRTSRRVRRWSSRRTPSSRGRRSRTPT